VLLEQTLKKNRGDAVDILFSTAWVPRFVIRYFHRDSDSREALLTRWTIWKLVEYVDSPLGQPGFDLGIDTIASVQYLWGLVNWGTITITTTTNANGATIHEVCSKLSKLNGLVVNLCVFFVDRDAPTNSTVPGTDQDPNFVKWYFSVDNYPYQSNKSRLALKTAFDSRFTVQQLSGDDAPANPATDDGLTLGGGVSDNDPNVRALVSWSKHIAVKGNGCSAVGNVTRTVVYSVQNINDTDVFPNGDTDGLDSSFNLRIVYHSFLTDCFCPTEIVWDPDMGLTGAMNFSPRISFSVFLFMAIFALFALL